MFKKLETYTWPGCYSIAYLDNISNAILCPNCAMVLQRSVTKFVHLEGEDIDCENCDKVIKSEYGTREDLIEKQLAETKKFVRFLKKPALERKRTK